MPLKRTQPIKDESSDDESAGNPAGNRPRKLIKSESHAQSVIAAWVAKLDSGVKHEPMETKTFETESTKEEENDDDDCKFHEGLVASVELANDRHSKVGMGADLEHSDNDVSSNSKASDERNNDDPDDEGLFKTKSALQSPDLPDTPSPWLRRKSLASSSNERSSFTPYPPSGLGCAAADSPSASSYTMDQEQSTATFREIIRIGGHAGHARIQYTLDRIDLQISHQRAIILNGKAAIYQLNKKRETVQKLRTDLGDLEHQANKILRVAREAIVDHEAKYSVLETPSHWL